MDSSKTEIKKYNQIYNANHSALITRGKTVDDLFTCCLMAIFLQVIMCLSRNKWDEYFDKQAHMRNLSHEGLMAMAMAKYNYLV